MKSNRPPPEPSTRKRATKAEMQLRARTATPKNTLLYPGLVQERQRMFDERMAKLDADSPVPPIGHRICNASMAHTTYRTGDGEVASVVRPGSMVAYGLPSHGDRT